MRGHFRTLGFLAVGFLLGNLAAVAIASRNSAGTYVLPSGNPVVSGTSITSSWANTTLGDIATELSASLDRQGRGAMLAPLQLQSGTASAPGLTFSAETNSGLYRAGAKDIRLQVDGTQMQRWISTGVAFPLAATVTGATTTQGGLTALTSTTNANAISATGNGTGNGVGGTGGTTSGAGLYGTGGTPNGRGVTGVAVGTGSGVVGTSGDAGTGAFGVFGQAASGSNNGGTKGVGAGTGTGVEGIGGTTSGMGVLGSGGSPNGVGLAGVGDGTGSGVTGTGGDTNGAGLFGTGGTPNGRGAQGQGTGAGTGVDGTGGTTSGTGLAGHGGAPNGRGALGEGIGTGEGGFFTGGATNAAGVVGHGGGSGSGAVGFAGNASAYGVEAVNDFAGPALWARSSVTNIDVGRIDGYLSLAGGTNPGSGDVLPNRLTPKNTLKAWIYFSLNATAAPTFHEGFHIESVTAGNTDGTITFASDFQSTDNYACTATADSPSATSIVLVGVTHTDARHLRYSVFGVSNNGVTTAGIVGRIRTDNTSGVSINIICVGAQ